MSSFPDRCSYACSHSRYLSPLHVGHSSLRCWISVVLDAQPAWCLTIQPDDSMEQQTMEERHVSGLAPCPTTGWASHHNQPRVCRSVFSSAAYVPPSHYIDQQMSGSSSAKRGRSEEYGFRRDMSGRAWGERWHSSDFEMAAVHAGLNP
jgi:hypothetical protein